MDQGVIYIITNKKNNKSYIGQCKNYKIKNEKFYSYGIKGRWSDHCSSAKYRDTPLYLSISEDGKDAFEIKEIIRDSLNNLDAREAYYINEYNTLVPNGYNVMRHGRIKGRKSTNIYEYYLSLTAKGFAVPINMNGVHRYIRVYLEKKNGEKIRLMFGTGHFDTYQSACQQAKDFASIFISKNIPFSLYFEQNTLISKYSDKISLLSQINLTKIRISTQKSGSNILLAVFFRPENAKSYKDEMRMCFGGKTISLHDAITTACLVIERLDINEEIIIISPALRIPEVRNRWPPSWLKEDP